MLHTFDPLSRNTSPSRVAVVSAPAMSDPPDGSDMNWTHSSSPRSIGGMWRCFCVSVAQSSSVGPQMEWVGVEKMNGISWISHVSASKAR